MSEPVPCQVCGERAAVAVFPSAGDFCDECWRRTNRPLYAGAGGERFVFDIEPVATGPSVAARLANIGAAQEAGLPPLSDPWGKREP